MMVLAGGDEECFAVAAIVVVIGVIVGVVILASNASARTAEIRGRAARRLGGRLDEGGWLTQRAIRYRVRDCEARIEFWGGGKNSPPYTRVVIDARGKSRGALKVFKEYFGSSIAKFFGAQDLTVGDRAFDADYIVKATPESLARQVFAPAERNDMIRAIRQLDTWSGGLLDLSRESMTVSVPRYLNDEEDIVRLADVADEMFSRIVGGSSPDTGIVWGASATVGGQCPVCGTDLAGHIVKCASCATPHHRECWDFNRACATFACGSQRHV